MRADQVLPGDVVAVGTNMWFVKETRGKNKQGKVMLKLSIDRLMDPGSWFIAEAGRDLEAYRGDR